MMYRYKLKNCKENENHEQRSLQGIVLHKKEWKVTSRPIDKLEKLMHLIEMEQFDERSEELQKIARKNREAKEALTSANEADQVVLEKKDTKKVSKFPRERVEVTELKKLSKKELIDEILKINSKDYSKNDFFKDTKEYILQTLILLKGIDGTIS